MLEQGSAQKGASVPGFKAGSGSEWEHAGRSELSVDRVLPQEKWGLPRWGPRGGCVFGAFAKVVVDGPETLGVSKLVADKRSWHRHRWQKSPKGAGIS